MLFVLGLEVLEVNILEVSHHFLECIFICPDNGVRPWNILRWLDVGGFGKKLIRLCYVRILGYSSIFS